MAKKKLKFPCQVCGKACRWGQKAIACSGCSDWYHKHCIQMDSLTYDTLANTTDDWHCSSCGLPFNFNSSLFEDTLHSNPNFTLASVSDMSSPYPGQPLMSSSPSSTSAHHPTRPRDNNIRIVNLNFRSIRNKREEFLTFLEMTDPDIVMGTETWCTSNDHSSELFPGNYMVYRVDRANDAGSGGVLLAVKHHLKSHQITTPTRSELVMATCKIGKLPVLLACGYIPPSSSLEYTQTFLENLTWAHQQHNDAVYLLGGDFNLPDINWENMSISSHQNTLAINNGYINTFEDIGLEQMVNFPTRMDPDNILDLVLTNRPSLIQRCEPLPGIADHVSVLVITKLCSPYSKPVKRKIHIWKKADMVTIREHIQTFSECFHECHNSHTPVQELWNIFIKEVQIIMTELVADHPNGPQPASTGHG